MGHIAYFFLLRVRSDAQRPMEPSPTQEKRAVRRMGQADASHAARNKLPKPAPDVLESVVTSVVGRISRWYQNTPACRI
jgi:hypothetical protein